MKQHLLLTLLILSACAKNEVQLTNFSSTNQCSNTHSNKVLCTTDSKVFTQKLEETKNLPLLNNVRSEYVTDLVNEYNQSTTSMVYSARDIYKNFINYEPMNTTNESLEDTLTKLGQGYKNETERLNSEIASYDKYIRAADYTNGVTQIASDVFKIPIGSGLDLMHTIITNQFNDSRDELIKEKDYTTAGVFYDAMGDNSARILAEFRNKYQEAKSQDDAQTVTAEFINSLGKKLRPQGLDGKENEQARLIYSQSMSKVGLSLLAGVDYKIDKQSKEFKLKLEDMSFAMAKLEINVAQGFDHIIKANELTQEGLEKLNKGLTNLNNNLDENKKMLAYLNRQNFNNLSPEEKMKSIMQPGFKESLDLSDKEFKDITDGLNDLSAAKFFEEKFSELMNGLSNAQKFAKLFGIKAEQQQMIANVQKVAQTGKALYDAYKVFNTAQNFTNFTNMASAAGKLAGLLSGGGKAALDPEAARFNAIMGKLDKMDMKLNQILEQLNTINTKLDRILESQVEILKATYAIQNQLAHISYVLAKQDQQLNQIKDLAVDTKYPGIHSCYQLKNLYQYDLLNPLIYKQSLSKNIDANFSQQISLDVINKEYKDEIKYCHNFIKNIFYEKYNVDARNEKDFFTIRSHETTILNKDQNQLEKDLLLSKELLKRTSENLNNYPLENLVRFVLTPANSTIEHFKKISKLSNELNTTNLNDQSAENSRISSIYSENQIISPLATIASSDLLLNSTPMIQYALKGNSFKTRNIELSLLNVAHLNALETVNKAIFQQNLLSGEVFLIDLIKNQETLNWNNDLNNFIDEKTKKDLTAQNLEQTIKNLNDNNVCSDQRLDSFSAKNISNLDTNTLRYCLLNRNQVLRENIIAELIFHVIYSTGMSQMTVLNYHDLTANDFNYMTIYNHKKYLTGRYDNMLMHSDFNKYPLLIVKKNNEFKRLTTYENLNIEQAKIIYQFAKSSLPKDCQITEDFDELPTCFIQNDESFVWHAFIGGVWTKFPNSSQLFKQIKENVEVPRYRSFQLIDYLYELRNRLQNNLKEMNSFKEVDKQNINTKTVQSMTILNMLSSHSNQP